MKSIFIKLARAKLCDTLCFKMILKVFFWEICCNSMSGLDHYGHYDHLGHYDHHGHYHHLAHYECVHCGCSDHTEGSASPPLYQNQLRKVNKSEANKQLRFMTKLSLQTSQWAGSSSQPVIGRGRRCTIRLICILQSTKVCIIIIILQPDKRLSTVILPAKPLFYL